LTLAAGASVYYSFDRLYLPVPVAVPKTAIEAKSLIGEKDVEVRYVSKADKHPGAVSSVGQAVGKYAEVRLYPGEQILSERLTGNPASVSGAFSFLAPDETYITFSSSEAKWPKGLKVGDTVTAAGFVNNQEIKLGEKLRVIAVTGDAKEMDIIKQARQALPQTSSDKITLAMKFTQAGPLLEGKAKAKELVFLPEHPNRTGGDIFERTAPAVQGTGQQSKENGKR